MVSLLVGFHSSHGMNLCLQVAQPRTQMNVITLFLCAPFLGPAEQKYDISNLNTRLFAVIINTSFYYYQLQICNFFTG